MVPHPNDMKINNNKRESYRRRVHEVLQQILNDPFVMPNVDCADLVVSVNRVDFGSTVRVIFVDAFGREKRSRQSGEEPLHERYLRQAAEQGQDTYIDLTDVFTYPNLLEIVAVELQKRLGLLYTPELKRL